MKNLLLISYLFIICSIAGCDKDDDKPNNPIDQLPPATQIGANTFGCLLDGEPFLPGNEPNSTNCYYQVISGENYFHVSADRRDDNHNLIALALNTNKLEIEEGQTLTLVENMVGQASGLYFYGTNASYTSQINSGELKITKLDFDSNIVSGTFWYDVQDTSGVVHIIREGRFDMQFTQ